MAELILDRSRSFQVFWTDRQSYLFKCSFADDYHHLELELEVTFPEWIIVSASGKWIVAPHEICYSSVENLQRLTGMKIGGGCRKKMLEILGGPTGCTHVFDLVFEAAILTMFVGNRARIDKIEKKPESPHAQLLRLAHERPWTIDSCLAMQRNRLNLDQDKC